MELPNYFIRLTIQHKYQEDLLFYLIKDILPKSKYFLGLHKSNYEHFHFLANYPNSLKELKDRFSQTSFRQRFGLTGLRNKIKVQEHNPQDYKTTIHYIMDGCKHSRLNCYTNIDGEEYQEIQDMKLPNKYDKNNDKITIRTIIRTVIKNISNNCLHQLHTQFDENELLKFIIDKTIYKMIENNISTKFQPLSEIILYEIVADLKMRDLEKVDSETRNSVLLYLGFFENKLFKKISNLIL